MEIGTGTAVTIMSQATWKALFPGLPLQQQDGLKTYTAEGILVLEQCQVTVQHNGQTASHSYHRWL